MLKSLRILFNKMENEKIPQKQRKEVIIKSVSKPGSIHLMDNKRGIFVTGHMINKLYEENTLDNIKGYISDYQTGGVKGKTTIDNIIVLSDKEGIKSWERIHI